MNSSASNPAPTDQPSRRSFLVQAVATGVTLAGAPYALGRQSKAAPPASAPASQPTTEPAEPPPPQFPDVRIAYIATGGIAGFHFENTIHHGVQCPCYCDVDTRQYERFAKQWPQAKSYQDYRQMFDKEHKNFDAVMIGTPDHHHYPATMIAMQLGKHVYTQKPLAHTPWEARQLQKAAAKYKVATQMGNQGHAGEGWRLVYEFVRSGVLGDIKETHTWSDRPIWPQGVARPKGEDPIPPQLDWDVWIGPAPLRPYKGPADNKDRGPYHPFNWRGWWDFGCGALGDMACHLMDGVFWSLEPGHPTSVESIAATPINDETYPTASALKWTFPARGGRPAFDAYWYDGKLIPRAPLDLEPDRNMPHTGNLFVGTKASLLVTGDYGESPRIIPEAKMKAFGKPKQLLERSPGHVLEWLMAVAGEKPLDYVKSNFAYAAPFTESILLGCIALRRNRRLEWDGDKFEFTNDAAANGFLTKPYRPGWEFKVD